ncbi:MAG: type II toxin-antitoxin system HicB family antitoxin [Clostridia bacterium]|nr:type II toxin-antitoxin system HicB family antitoxin [Clostridia bacterium]
MRNNLDYYLSLKYQPILVPDIEEGGYGVYYPDLPGCLSCGETVEEALENAEDAKREWIISMLEENRQIPEPTEYGAKTRMTISLPAALKKRLSETAADSGLSVEEYCVNVLSGAVG